MNRRTSLTSLAAAALLSAAVALPAAAGAPTYEGDIYCVVPGWPEPLNMSGVEEKAPYTPWTKKSINQYIRDNNLRDNCVKGTIEFVESA